VWSEPSLCAAAAREFEDMDDMLAACERQFGPYRWGRYDVLVLPPAFPFGGMENPRVTFVTPTLLAGDKSLVALIAHEMAHSWSGNLVSNATWRDFWLNEGFTVYLEQRIMEAVFGRERADMEIQLGMQQLDAELAELPAADEVLHIDLSGRNPDDGMSAVPYEKGAAFLRRLEQVFGRERFDGFLAGYFEAHAFTSITTDQFVAHLRRELFAPNPTLAAHVDVARWVHAPGLPKDAPRPQSSLLRAVDEASRAWLLGKVAAAELPARAWLPQQWLHFLQRLPADVDAARLAELDAAYGLTRSYNSEILCAWLEVAIERGYAGADAAAEEFLLRVGRRKYLKPIYAALAKTPAGRVRAHAIYKKARDRYHAVATRTLDELLGYAP
jgi:hypothetical protein